jgi:hypothetical protein
MVSIRLRRLAIHRFGARWRAILREWQSPHIAKETPNPSIEGTHKRLRLLRSPHVKR